MCSQKGFIGPIGDDLPSLVPLLLALTIFFLTFTNAWNSFDLKRGAFESDLSALQVARILRSSSYIAGPDNFYELCSTLNVQKLKYFAGLVDAVRNPEERVRLDFRKPQFIVAAEDKSELKEKPYRCTNLEIDPDETEPPLPEDKPVLMKVYPVALEENRIVRPTYLVVIAWRG